jgi:hypothetical protein
MRCPVEGCEPWTALDEGNKGALPQPQAMLTRERQFLRRKADDRSKLDPLDVCAPRSQHNREQVGENVMYLEYVMVAFSLTSDTTADILLRTSSV